MKLQEMPKIERPREKLIHYGPEKLSHSELLAILLRTGNKDENVVLLANKIIKKFGLECLPQAKYTELKDLYGLGPAKACEIVACFELGKRCLKEKRTHLFLKPQDVFNELKDIRDNKKEHFVIFYLDTRNQEIKRETISVGSLNASLVHPREVFEPAVRNIAAHIIIAHNHPSGEPTPSDEDIKLTHRLREAGKIMGIEILDHIIVTKHTYLSFKEQGIL